VPRHSTNTTRHSCHVQPTSLTVSFKWAKCKQDPLDVVLK